MTDTIPSVRTIIWSMFAATIITGATSSPAILLAADLALALSTAIVTFCTALMVMLQIGPKIPGATPQPVVTETVVTEVKKTTVETPPPPDA